jgi:probable rRNA maturation factor
MPFLVAVRAAVEEVHCCNFSVAFVSDRRMKELNQLFRGKDSTTDVLSFPHEPDEFETAYANNLTLPDDPLDESIDHRFIGDIVISVEQAERQAKENDLALDLEIKQLILHGVLHLCGFDHEADDGEMNARELELREKLGI